MKFLVISYRHGLLPLTHRLRSEGHDVELLMWRKRFEKAWGAVASPKFRGSQGEIRHDSLQGLVEEAKRGDVVVVSDAPGDKAIPEMFEGTGGFLRLPTVGEATALRVGWWFDGETLAAPHLLLYDMGVWPGGMGASVPGGLTLVMPRPETDLSLLEPLEREVSAALKPRGFKGLVNASFDRNPDPDGGLLGAVGMEAGWPFLHTDAWLSSTSGMGSLLQGGSGVKPESPFTVVLPVSVPPWPFHRGEAKAQGLDGLHPDLQGKYFWYDMDIADPETRRLSTAGLDGLVAVARGEGRTFEKARSYAIALAGALPLREKQFRVDVGAAVPRVLAQLEELFGIVL